MDKKITKMGLIFLSLIFFLPSLSLGWNEPDGFMDVKFGEEPKTIRECPVFRSPTTKSQPAGQPGSLEGQMRQLEEARHQLEQMRREIERELAVDDRQIDRMLAREDD